MTASAVMVAALQGAAFAVRVFVGIAAMLLIIRSLFATYLPVLSWRFLRILGELTGMMVEPVRNLLPSPLGCRKPDYASLVTAVILLLFGYGVSEMILLMARKL